MQLIPNNDISTMPDGSSMVCEVMTLNADEELIDKDFYDVFGFRPTGVSDENANADVWLCDPSIACQENSLFDSTTVSLPVNSVTCPLPSISREIVTEESCFYIDDSLAELHVRLYMDLKIFTCMQCYTGVAPSNLDGHMRQKHKYLVPRSKVEILVISDGYGVLPCAGDVVFPDVMAPIPDLETTVGFYCSGNGCHYAAQKHRTMLQHLRIHHSRGETAVSDTCIVQIPFSSVGSYRRVTSHSLATYCMETLHVEEDITILESSFAQAVLDDNVLRMTRDPGDTPPWLERMYWTTLVHHVNPKVLVGLVSLPSSEETCLNGVRLSLYKYFEWIGAIIHSDRFTTTLKHLHTPKKKDKE